MAFFKKKKEIVEEIDTVEKEIVDRICEKLETLKYIGTEPITLSESKLTVSFQYHSNYTMKDFRVRILTELGTGIVIEDKKLCDQLKRAVNKCNALKEEQKKQEILNILKGIDNG